jgi:ribosomal protein L7/L12
LAELLGVLFPFLVVLYLIVNTQLDSYRKRMRFLEVKVDALMKHTGIAFDDRTLVPVEVHQAVKAGQRLKAIRLYRKITGAGLTEASEVIDGLVKNT